MKISEPRKTCLNANKVFNIVNRSELKVPAKVYYNLAKAYRLLCEYDQAEKYLEKAKKLEPNNTTIAEEQVILDAAKNQDHQMEKNIVKKMLGGI